MPKEVITSRQAICVIIMFLLGSSVITGNWAEAGQDSWIVLLFTMAATFPLILMYARIAKLFPTMDLFDIIIVLFGNIGGKIMIILLTWYALHVASGVMRHFSEFIEIVAMPETPKLPLMITMFFVTLYLAKSGIETLAKWSVFVLPVVFIGISLSVIFSVPNMDFSNILPIMGHSFSQIGKIAFNLSSLPFGETVLFLCLFSSIKKDDNPYKIYTLGIFLGTMILLLTVFRNIFSLGVPMLQASTFPSFTTVRLIHLGDFFSRLEGTFSADFIFVGVVKITVALLAASKGVAKLLNIENYTLIIMPVCLFSLSLSPIIFSSILDMQNFFQYNTIYTFPFQIIIPLLIWVTGEIKTWKKTRQNAS